MRERLTRLAAIARKEVKQLARDRLTFGMIVGVPLLQIVLFGYAIDLDVRHLRAAVADHAGTSASRELVRFAEASQIVDIIAAVSGPQALERGLDAGDFDVGIYIPPDFERRLQDGRPAAQLLINGSDPTIEGIARRLAELPRPYAKASPPDALFETRTFYNPERRSQVQITPGLIGVILNLTMEIGRAHV